MSRYRSMAVTAVDRAGTSGRFLPGGRGPSRPWLRASTFPVRFADRVGRPATPGHGLRPLGTPHGVQR